MAMKGDDPDIDPPVYSPTSPASDVPDNELDNVPPEEHFTTPGQNHDKAHIGLTNTGSHKDSDGSWKQKTSESETRRAPVWVPTEEHTTDQRTSESAPKKVYSQTCPELVTGSKLDKAVPMHPGHWVKIGRNPKAHLMCNNAGVSRNQVSLKWDAHEKKVEMRLEAKSGTLVNGKEERSSRRLLEHGDRIRIIGKGQTFDFLLDLRPVGLGSGDPRYRARVAADKTKSGPTQRRDTLRAQLQHLEKAIAHLEGKAFEREKEYYEIATRRRLRAQEQAESQDKHKFYIEDAVLQQGTLESGRQAWRDKLDAEHAANAEVVAPIIAETSSLQDKLEKLQLKKDEVARSIHPENYAVADVALSIGAPSEDEGGTPRPKADHDDAEGEEDAFAGLSGLEDRGLEDSSDDEPVAKPKAPKRDALDSGSEEAAAFLHGGSDDEGKPDAKRPRLDEQPLMSIVSSSGAV